MAKAQERPTSNLKWSLLSASCWAQLMNSSSLKWVLDFFFLCLPSALAFLKPHVFMYVHVLKDDLGQFLRACKRVLSLAVRFPQPGMLQLDSHNLLCLPDPHLKLEFNLYTFSICTTYTKAKERSSRSLFKDMRYFCFLSVKAGMLQQLSLFCFYLPYSYMCIWERGECMRQRACIMQSLLLCTV